MRYTILCFLQTSFPSLPSPPTTQFLFPLSKRIAKDSTRIRGRRMEAVLGGGEKKGMTGRRRGGRRSRSVPLRPSHRSSAHFVLVAFLCSHASPRTTAIIIIIFFVFFFFFDQRWIWSFRDSPLHTKGSNSGRGENLGYEGRQREERWKERMVFFFLPLCRRHNRWKLIINIFKIVFCIFQKLRSCFHLLWENGCCVKYCLC